MLKAYPVVQVAGRRSNHNRANVNHRLVAQQVHRGVNPTMEMFGDVFEDRYQQQRDLDAIKRFDDGDNNRVAGQSGGDQPCSYHAAAEQQAALSAVVVHQPRDKHHHHELHPRLDGAQVAVPGISLLFGGEE